VLEPFLKGGVDIWRGLLHLLPSIFMANTVLIGAQWGDEGKGKIIDVLTDQVDVVVRSQGGNNAGHTILFGKEKYVLHLVPSGILRKGKMCVIGNGVVVDAVALVSELDGLIQKGVKISKNFYLSETAHLVFPYHRALDEQREAAKGKGKIGTTKRGIGPAYSDKMNRVGLRVIDLLTPALFREKLAARVDDANKILAANGGKKLDFKAIAKDYLQAGERLKPYIANTVLILHQCLKKNKSILFEGAQGTFLDIDHGTYPYVTSSNTIAGGACTGSGVPPHSIDVVMGVMKAYTTRVGEGPFPTENKELGDYLHGLGREFGSTTGRARRCGWFDAVSVRFSQAVNGINQLAITNLDGLDSMSRIKVCVAYKANGKRYDYPPNDLATLQKCEPVYREFPGWMKPTSAVRSFNKLPTNAKAYLRAIEEMSGAKLKIVSVDAQRDATFFC